MKRAHRERAVRVISVKLEGRRVYEWYIHYEQPFIMNDSFSVTAFCGNVISQFGGKVRVDPERLIVSS